jgi:hypothetical protein
VNAEITSDDLDLLRHRAMPALFGGIRAPSTLGVVPALVRMGSARRRQRNPGRKLCRGRRASCAVHDAESSPREV